MTEPIDSANKLFNQSFLNLSLISHAARWWAHSLLVLVVLAGYICTESTKPAFAQERSNSVSSVQCQAKNSKECTPQEKWAWEQIVQGKPANMNDYLDDDQDIQPLSKDSKPRCQLLNAGEPIKQSSRTLRPEFIEFVATHPRYEQGANTRMVHIECAVVDEQIDLANKKIRPKLTISASLLKNGIDIHDAHFLRSFTIEKSSVTGTVNSAGALFDRSLLLIENRHEQVILDNAQIKANLLVEDSTLTKTFLAQAIDVGGNIDLKRTVFEGPVNLIGAKTAGILFTKDSQFKGKFNASNLDAAGGIFLINITFSTTVYLIGAKTAGILFAKDSQFKGKFDAINFAASDMILSNVSFDKRVGLLDMKLGKQLEIKDSVFKDEFDAENIEASARIVLTNTTFKKTVNLKGAKTAGTLSADGSQFKGKFMANDLDVSGNIFLRDTTFKKTVRLTSAKTAGILFAKDSQFKGEFRANSLDVAIDMFLGNVSFEEEVNLVDAKIGKESKIINSVFENEFKAENIEANARIFLTNTTFKKTVDLTRAKTDTLQLSGSIFASELDLSQTHIANSFVLYEAEETNEGKMKASVPLWKEGAELMLNDAHAGVLQARMPESWLIYDDNSQPTSTLLTRDLHGFTYDSLHLTEGNEIDDEKITRLIEWAGGTTTTIETETLWDYLPGKQCRALEWQKGETKYTPQPYTELAGKLREMGTADQADRVLVARDNHHHAKQYSEGKLWSFIIGKIDCFVLSYRVEPIRPLVSFLWLIVLFAPLNFFAYKPSYKQSKKRLERLFYYVFRPLFHSVGNSIPIPGFLGHTKETRAGRLIYLLYAQKIIGLILLISAGYIAI